MATTQQRNEEKIHQLTSIIIDNDEAGRTDNEELIHPDFIEAMEGLAELQSQGDNAKETMKRMNELYQKHKKIKEEAQNEEKNEENSVEA